LHEWEASGLFDVGAAFSPVEAAYRSVTVELVHHGMPSAARYEPAVERERKEERDHKSDAEAPPEERVG
jgi:hypothetical protein